METCRGSCTMLRTRPFSRPCRIPVLLTVLPENHPLGDAYQEDGNCQSERHHSAVVHLQFGSSRSIVGRSRKRRRRKLGRASIGALGPSVPHSLPSHLGNAIELTAGRSGSTLRCSPTPPLAGRSPSARSRRRTGGSTTCSGATRASTASRTGAGPRTSRRTPSPSSARTASSSTSAGAGAGAQVPEACRVARRCGGGALPCTNPPAREGSQEM